MARLMEHEIKSHQSMIVERDWKFTEDEELYHESSTIQNSVGEETFSCSCGETFENKEEAEKHL